MDDVSRAIGALEASVESINKGQAAVSKSVKVVETDVSTVKQDVAHIKQVLDQIGPAAKKINDWEQRMLGIGLLVASGGGAITLVFTFLKEHFIG